MFFFIASIAGVLTQKPVAINYCCARLVKSLIWCDYRIVVTQHCIIVYFKYGFWLLKDVLKETVAWLRLSFLVIFCWLLYGNRIYQVDLKRKCSPNSWFSHWLSHCRFVVLLEIKFLLQIVYQNKTGVVCFFSYK